MKRFTDTDIWIEDWFNELEIEYQMFWFYLKDNCNHAGIWKPNKSRFEQITKHKIDLKKALELFNAEKIRIEVLKSGHWFIISFFKFQYGETMNLNNRVHKSISDIYEKENITLTSIRGQIDLKDRVKDKDKDKEENKEKVADSENEQIQILMPIAIFDSARRIFPGTKRGIETEYNDFKKKHKDYKKAIELLISAIQNEIDWRNKAEKFNENKKDKEKIFIPQWKNFKTWLSQRCWEQTLPEISEAKQTGRKILE